MRSLYRRSTKIRIVPAAEEKEAHGWATTRDAHGNEARVYFRADQPRFIQTLKQDGAATLRLRLEKMDVANIVSITVRRMYNTYTFNDLSFRADRAQEVASVVFHEPRRAA